MSTLKVNTIEKYSGSSGVTVKDTVTIAPESGVKNLVVSGTITAETSLTSVGDITAQGNIVGDNATNISGINQITGTSATLSGSLSCGTLTVGGNQSLAPWKAVGGFRLVVSNNVGTVSNRISEYNVASVTTGFGSSQSVGYTHHWLDINFSTALTNTNYLVFPSTRTNSINASLFSVSKSTDKVRLTYSVYNNNATFNESFLVLST